MTTSPLALPSPPIVVPKDVAALRADLRQVRYDVEHLAQVVGPEAIAALEREQRLPALEVARSSGEDVAALLRLFALGDAVPRGQVDAALAGTGSAGLERIGLIRGAGAGLDDDVVALVDLRPIQAGQESLLVASDLGEVVTGAPVHPDYVLGVGGAGRTLAELTVRTGAGSVLDLGTGCGIQALNVAPFSQRVVGTDISTRALAFAQFNAALGGLELDLRRGDMFEPVAGETFDLIVSNPPFVITPRTGGQTMTYRDGGRSGDDLIAGLTRTISDYLAPGGVAQFLANWEIPAGAHWSERLEEWTAGLDADVWVIQREAVDPYHYAETWLRDGGLSPERDREAWEAAYRDYRADFAARDVEAIGFGYVTLRRCEDRAPWRRFEELHASTLTAPSAAVAATLSAIEHLQGDPLASAYMVASDVTEERHYMPGQADPQVITLHQGGAMGRNVRVSSHVAALVGASDGELTAGQIVGALSALTDEPADDIAGQVVPVLRELVLDGFLHPLTPAR